VTKLSTKGYMLVASTPIPLVFKKEFDITAFCTNLRKHEYEPRISSAYACNDISQEEVLLANKFYVGVIFYGVLFSTQLLTLYYTALEAGVPMYKAVLRNGPCSVALAHLHTPALAEERLVLVQPLLEHEPKGTLLAQFLRKRQQNASH